MATIKDVALLAKVGVGTASRAISGKGSVSPDALQRVQEAVRRLDFRPSRTARALASKSLGLVGVFVPTFEGTYFAPILQAIESELRAHDQHMVAASNFGRGTRRSKSLNGLRFLIERECDGILSVDSYTMDEDLRALRQKMRRLVLINRVVPGLEEDCFSIDHHKAGRLAARALLAHGHRALATMHSVRHSPEVVSRMEGFRAELAEHGLLPAQEFVIDGLLNFVNGWQQAGAIVALRKRPFTALFCATDVLAMATLSRLQAAGIRVPRDLSVLGFDGAELGAYTSPALSTVHVPSTVVATQACRHLINQCYGTRLDLQRHFEAEVVVRESIAPGPHPTSSAAS
ncbi:MAG: LacI family DNA-binding transcriptional regulator [Burkholderiaceae bacterium]